MAVRDIEKTIYNGAHNVSFRAAAHRYYIDGKPRQGVTTIIGKVLAKEGLMLWPLNMALKYLRENTHKDIGEDGSTTYTISDKDLDAAAKAHTARRDAGADTGSQVHAWAEAILVSGVLPTQGEISLMQPEVWIALESFIAWYQETKPEVIAVEQVVYSEGAGGNLEYAGTFDAILRIDGITYLCDLKTTNASRTAPQGAYAEYFVQLGGYYHAYEEQRIYELHHSVTALPPIDDLMIISCRKDGNFNIVTGSQLNLTPQAAGVLWLDTLHLYEGLGDISKKLERGL